MVKNQDIQIRDPYIFVNKEECKYYLFGSTDEDIWNDGIGLDVYIGEDLENWSGPYPAFRPDSDFYSDVNYWAPEVHEYNGRYYMFATFLRRDNQKRGTAILVSDSLTGPFIKHSDGPVTPKEWFSLDGTLHIDKDGLPWLVFCHEWVQIGDGEICAMRLSEDLKEAVGEPVTLFKSSDAPWTKPIHRPNYPDRENYVTDGPFMYHANNGDLLMLWSSYVDSYAQGISKSLTGEITGPWVHEETPLFQSDGGHGMLFKDFKGELHLTLHTPNKTPLERPIFIPVKEENGKIVAR